MQQQQDAQQPLDAARRLRAVQKKLRQIEGIAEKAAAGQALQPEEAAKLAQQQDLEAEAARLAALG